MSLLPSELDLIRYELGWNELTTGAEPYVGVAALFDRVVLPFLRSGLITTSSTAVTAATPAAPVALTLAAVSGTNTQGTTVTVSAGDKLVIDVDDLQESATVESISGNIVTVPLSLAHTGVYPVTVEGGESLVRSILRRCRKVSASIESAMDNAGLKKVDEVEFFPSAGGGSSMFGDLVAQQKYWRNELYRVLFGVGDRSLTGQATGAGGLVSIY